MEIIKVTSEMATLKTAKIIRELEELCFSDPWGVNGILFSLHDLFSICFVVKEDEKFIGFASIQTFDKIGTITTIASHPDYRRNGIGSSLLTSLLKSQPLNEVTLDVRVGNLPAINLYQKFGFDILTTRKNQYSNPTEDGYLMKLIINKGDNNKELPNNNA